MRGFHAFTALAFGLCSPSNTLKPVLRPGTYSQTTRLVSIATVDYETPAVSLSELLDSGGVTSQTTGSKASRFAFLRSFSTKGSQALLGQQNSLVSLDSYAFPTHEKSVTLSAATTRSKMAAMKLQASEGDGDEDALSPV